MSSKPEKIQPRLTDPIRQSRSGLLVVRLPDPGLLLAEGEDWLEFLDRISTNSLADLQPGQARQTLLTNALGRLIDHLWAIRRGGRGWLLTSASRLDRVHSWLEQYIFFRDDVRLRVLDEPWQMWGLFGPKAEEYLRNSYGLRPEVPPAKRNGEDEPSAWRIESPAAGVMLLLRPEQAHPMLKSSAAASLAAQAAYDYLRLEAGQLRVDLPSLPDCTPLELGLHPLIDFEKGCYIGQEVIARMESRGKAPRRLVRIRLNAAEEAGTPILCSGREAGTLLEISEQPQGGFVGLALLRTNLACDDGEPLLLSGQPVDPELIDRPYMA